MDDFQDFIEKTKYLLPKELMIIRRGLLADLIGITKTLPLAKEDELQIKRKLGIVNLRLRALSIMQLIGWDR